jgi:hypothetical protein
MRPRVPKTRRHSRTRTSRHLNRGRGQRPPRSLVAPKAPRSGPFPGYRPRESGRDKGQDGPEGLVGESRPEREPDRYRIAPHDRHSHDAGPHAYCGSKLPIARRPFVPMRHMTRPTPIETTSVARAAIGLRHTVRSKSRRRQHGDIAARPRCRAFPRRRRRQGRSRRRDPKVASTSAAARSPHNVSQRQLDCYETRLLISRGRLLARALAHPSRPHSRRWEGPRSPAGGSPPMRCGWRSRPADDPSPAKLRLP